MSSVVRFGRRQFLRGAGGFTLALPFLPSLLPSGVEAQSSAPARRFVALATQHGGIWGGNMYPTDAALTQTQALYTGHDIRRGALSPSVSGGRASLAPVLTASSGVLTSALASKMNVLRGLDIPFYIGHHTGGHLGNYARNDGNGSTGVAVQGDTRPTIDQIMAWSPSFYSDLGSIKQRSIHIGDGGGRAISWGYSNPQAKQGAIQALPTAYSSLDLFNSIFVPPSSTPAEKRVPVVQRVLESYQRLRSKASSEGARLSKADLQRLEDHMDRLSELERRLTVTGVSAGCGDIARPSKSVDQSMRGGSYSITPPSMRDWYQTFNDVIVAAFICGTSRICTIQSLETWSTYTGDWHQEVAHQADQPDGAKEKVIADAHQRFFEDVFVDLISKLDVEEADGRTYLDNSLVMWTQESGMGTHHPISIPVITAGSAGGFLRAGNYCDYRNRDNLGMSGGNSPPTRDQRPGILYNQWLATVLQAMGVPPSEFERNGEHGYGLTVRADYATNGKLPWSDTMLADASKIVPFLRA